MYNKTYISDEMKEKAKDLFEKLKEIEDKYHMYRTYPAPINTYAS